MFYVYKIKNIINNKLYIGKAENVNERWLKHLSDARTNRGYVFHSAINKYGANNFEVSIIEECESDLKSLEREIFWIAEYKTNICKYGNEFGYNLTDGGEGITGHHHSDEAKQKMSLASKGKSKSEEHKAQLRVSHKGKVLTEQHKKNIGKGGTGKFHKESSKIKMGISKIGDKNPRAVLNEQFVREIKSLLQSNVITIKDISIKYGVASRTIRDIKNNKTWRHIT